MERYSPSSTVSSVANSNNHTQRYKYVEQNQLLSFFVCIVLEGDFSALFVTRYNIKINTLLILTPILLHTYD